MSTEPARATLLQDLGALRVRGADAVRFLQGQLSNDVGRLDAQSSQRAGYHNPQGRTIALARLVWLGSDEILALLPRELVGPLAARLGRYVLRAKVTLTDASEQWQVWGVVRSADAPPRLGGLALPGVPDAQAQHGAVRAICVGDAPARWLVVAPREIELPLRAAAPDARREWHRLDVAGGEPQVFATTSELFVAQMLNLDAIGAIAFDKGCYTGQEVIARAHYRGRVKRRMQRFRSHAPVQLAPGAAGRLDDGRPFRVVDAVQLDDGRCEFLAVAPLGAGSTEAEGEAEGSVVVAETLPLPYALAE